jgi:adenosylcobinamide kinase/adenosylcobinamide-phosphate guanylyltransferase
MKELILGGVRSGKSRLAEARARASGARIIYVATAVAGGDAELDARIAQHRARRPAAWQLIEEPVGLARVLRHHAVTGCCVVVECLTLWLTNLLCAPDPQALAREREALLEALPTFGGDLILVSNETGLGVVPLGALSRRFVDESGALHQALAALCDRVTHVVAGLPLTLKGATP